MESLQGFRRHPMHLVLVLLALFFLVASSWLFDYKLRRLEGGNYLVEVAMKSTLDDLETVPATSTEKLVISTKEIENDAVSKKPPLRFCGSMEKIRPSRGGPTRGGFFMRYRCEGPKYDEFGPQLHEYAQNASASKNPLWGRRGVPPNSTNLVVGNSHLQQVIQSLVCQENSFGSGLVEVESLDPEVDYMVMLKYTFGNGAVLYHASNTYAIHVANWTSQLETQLGGVPLSSFDHVVVGTVNSCTPPIRTKFAEGMKELLLQRFGFECQKPLGPSFTEYADAFRQPLLYVSMFARYANHQKYADMEDFKAVGFHEEPMRFKNARTYINEMGADVWECGSLSLKVKLDCENNSTAGNKLHRCTGAQGGHADLVAWDVVEFLNSNYQGFDLEGKAG